MTDNLLQKLEEKVMALVLELEDLRKEVHLVRQENIFLKTDKTNQTQKLQNLISLLEATSLEVAPVSEYSFSQNHREEAAVV
jgi:regulator of replication initiation timing